jgi:hypothetical protein
MRIDQRGFRRLLEDGYGLLAGHGREVLEDLVERIPSLEAVDQGADGKRTARSTSGRLLREPARDCIKSL